MKKIQNLTKKVKSYNSKLDEELINNAYEFAKTYHGKQSRASGEAFIEHPLEVAFILAELEMDEATIVAALLHDILEDTDASLKQLERTFSPEIASMIDGVTKLSHIKFKTQKEHQAENLRKMFLAMARDLRVVLIKLADRLHNMRTVKYLSEDKRKRIAKETREIYAPLAHRLGIFQLKWQLEDLAFETLENKKYDQISKMVDQKRAERERYIKDAIRLINKEIKKQKVKAEINGRVKHFYSIYQKIAKKDKDFNEIYDLLAIRILVEDKKDCYAVLGALHNIYKPVPGRFKDFIAVPKANMYQSLHTTVVGEEGNIIEIQIRSREMHRVAEYGVAAHWTYKEGLRGKKKQEQLAWITQVLQQNEASDSAEFLEGLKSDLLEKEVFVFTPKGDVKSFPVGATPIDFAYSIHTEVGHALIGAKANQKIVPFEYKLQTGDMVDILTSKSSSGPSKDWINLAKTSKARSRIRQFFSKEVKEDSVYVGKEELLKVLRKYKITFVISKHTKLLDEVSAKMNFKKTQDLFASIGQGKTSAKQVATKIVNELSRAEEREVTEDADVKTTTKRKAPSKTGVAVKGIDEVLIRLARCCNPVPRDDIAGFVTRGRGVSVHRKDCENVASLERQTPDRMIDVFWDLGKSVNFQVELQVEALDRVKLLKDISITISDSGVNIISANVSTTKDGFAIFRFLVEIGNIAHLDNIIRNVRKVEAVFDAHRI